MASDDLFDGAERKRKRWGGWSYDIVIEDFTITAGHISPISVRRSLLSRLADFLKEVLFPPS